MSGHRKKPTEHMGTHILENAEGRVSWYVETMGESRKRVVIETNAWN